MVIKEMKPIVEEGSSTSMQPLFIETTACVDLLLGDPQVRRHLEQILSNHDTWTSMYVFMEFRRTAIHALDVVRRLAIAAPDDEHLYTTILRSIERGIGGFPNRLNQRQQKRSREALCMVMDHLGTIPATRYIITNLLDTTILLVNDLTWIGIKHIVNGTDCDLVQTERPQGKIWPLRCNAHHAQCSQNAFVNLHRTELATVLTKCEADTTFDDLRMIKTLKNILAISPLKATGEKRCWAIADLVIALEALPAQNILSSNIKHFAPICSALALSLISYSPYPT